jgi:hypothetical protein
MISPIKLVDKFTRKKYILIVTNYATKWVEVKAFRTNNVVVITKFLCEYILIRFGCPLTTVTD